MKGAISGLLGLFLMAVAAQAQFTYTTNADAIMITGYLGSNAVVAIPSTIDNLPVAGIGVNAFANISSLTSVIIPDTVTSIGDFAFQACSSLTNVMIQSSFVSLGEEAFSYCGGLTDLFFWGDFPALGYDVFAADDSATAYYLPGANGWSTNVGGIPALLWNPIIQTGDGSFGVSNRQFGFNITGTSNIPIVLEACTDLSISDWSPLQSLALTNGLFYFSEPLQTNVPGRYYRIISP
jgi:hypothetical protein